MEGVKENATVAINRDIAVALKVERFDRLRLKTIRKQVHDAVKKLDQEYNVHVTTDKKLFMQLQQMEQELSSPREKVLLQELQGKFDKLIRDMQK
ncbi:MAG: Sporulation lipoprotein YhcN/YlaJ (Spore_YhcN_YlaJ) [Firmicutes bacterium ADurb.Bin456]|nr:MAG: Sporulation lipoprotein YhcN/YlaJ (Spore_YhcN_YlaJ) [Firmicutes bacterium ADurb.Bin456]